MSEESTETWKFYYEKTGSWPPRDTLLFALDRFETEPAAAGRRFAIDLGCGNGRDTIELLRRSWHVLAVDAEAAAIRGLTSRDDLPPDCLLETQIGRFEDITLPEADLVNSSFALPLVDPPSFPHLWNNILNCLRSGGCIACQLYGDRDSWVGRPGITFFTKRGIDALLEPLDVEFFREEEDDSVTPRGHQKHWHIFHIVAKRP